MRPELVTERGRLFYSRLYVVRFRTIRTHVTPNERTSWRRWYTSSVLLSGVSLSGSTESTRLVGSTLTSVHSLQHTIVGRGRLMSLLMFVYSIRTVLVVFFELFLNRFDNDKVPWHKTPPNGVSLFIECIEIKDSFHFPEKGESHVAGFLLTGFVNI